MNMGTLLLHGPYGASLEWREKKNQPNTDHVYLQRKLLK